MRALDPVDPVIARRHDRVKDPVRGDRAPVTETRCARERRRRNREPGDTPDRGCRDLRKVALAGM
ncbi:hypothetical protein GCM10010429_12570 [Micromonospora olivasterospora]